MRSDAVVGYVYRADIYCPDCIIDKMTIGEGTPFEGWALAGGLTMDVENNLDEIAVAFGIDRYDESTYDSDDFPKVVFADQVEGDEHCGACHEPLIE